MPTRQAAVVLCVALVVTACGRTSAGEARQANPPAPSPPAPLPGLNVTAVRFGQIAAPAPSPHIRMLVQTDTAHAWLWAEGLNCPPLVGQCARIVTTADGGQTWNAGGLLPPNALSADLSAAGTGFADDGDELWRTTDSGRTWIALARPERAAVGLLHVAAPGQVWTVSGGEVVSVDPNGAPARVSLRAADCYIQTVGLGAASSMWAGGGGPRGPCLYTTSDGGRKWTRRFAGADDPAVASAEHRLSADPIGCNVSQVYPDAGWMTWDCGSGSSALHTGDGGLSWSYGWSWVQGQGNPPPQFVAAAPGDTAWRLAPGDTLQRTDDGGVTWVGGGPLGLPRWCCALVSFADAHHGLAATEAGVLRTEDGGATWIRTWPVTPSPLVRAAAFSGHGRAWAADPPPDLALWRTDDAGQTWRRLPKLSLAGPIAGMVFTDASHGWAWSQLPQAVLATTDGGVTWEALPLPADLAPRELAGLTFADAVHGWLLGTSGLWRTENGGRTWKRLSGLSGWVEELTMISPEQGYALMFQQTPPTGPIEQGQRTLLVTTDGGQSWSTVATWPWFYPPAKDRFSGAFLAAATPANVWIATDLGLLRSSDGGATWVEDALPWQQASMAGLTFTDANHGAFQSGGVFYWTDDGGRTWVPSARS